MPDLIKNGKKVIALAQGNMEFYPIQKNGNSIELEGKTYQQVPKKADGSIDTSKLGTDAIYFEDMLLVSKQYSFTLDSMEGNGTPYKKAPIIREMHNMGMNIIIIQWDGKTQRTNMSSAFNSSNGGKGYITIWDSGNDDGVTDLTLWGNTYDDNENYFESYEGSGQTVKCRFISG